ncbi:MAG: hypothetical protein FGM32_02085 [Candidatus Kapabacteria bacterium]|nr:hypothetical protein [Candidatus Kapabacteria bacterium]
MARLLLVGVALAWISACAPPDKKAVASREELSLKDTSGAKTQTPAAAGIKGLVLRYRAGDVFRYRVHQETSGGPDTARTRTKSTHCYTRTVRSIRSDGSFETVMRFDSISVSAVVSNGRTGQKLVEQSYRSSDTSADVKSRFPQFSALIGEEVLVYLTSDGRVQQVGDVTPIVKKITASSQQQVPPAALEQLASQIKASIYASFSLQEFVPYPKQEIDSAGRWVNEQVTPLSDIFSLTTTATYTIERIYELNNRHLGVVSANVVGNVRVAPLPKGSPLSITVSSSSITGESKALMDIDRGYTISKKNRITMNMTARVRMPQGGEQTVSQTQDSRYEIELLP